MFKYIYVFILIVILFGIKWKLQNKTTIKEEFTVAADTLPDMFNSSSDFYNKLNLINSNIKFGNNLSWNLDTAETIWFEHKGTNYHNRIELRPEGIVIGDNINGIHDKVYTSVDVDKLSFQLQRFSLQKGEPDPLSTSNFASFNIAHINNSNINESISNLKLWHTSPPPSYWVLTPPGYPYTYTPIFYR